MQGRIYWWDGMGIFPILKVQGKSVNCWYSDQNLQKYQW